MDDPKRKLELGGWRATAVLTVFCMHNAWTCWVFLNFTNITPAATLLGVSREDTSAITAAGWYGTLLSIPVVTLCPASWHRPILLMAGVLNVTAPVMRYVAALPGSQSFGVIVITEGMNGIIFGVFTAWPAMFAALQWPAERHTLVTALGALSNYAGGALSAPVMPLVASTAEDLLFTFKVQAILSVPLALVLGVWLAFLPPYRSPAAAAEASLGAQLRRSCCEPFAAALLLTVGLAVGLSLLLQGIVQEMLVGIGFSDVEAGYANCVYQSASAVLGVVLGSQLTTVASLVPSLHLLHGLSAVSFLALSAVCASLLAAGRAAFAAAPALMLGAMTALGASLMGMLPVALQLAVGRVHAPENVVCGLIYMIAMVIAASLTTVVSSLNGGRDWVLLAALLAAELVGYFVIVPALDCERAAARSARGALY